MKNIFIENGELIIGGNGKLCSLQDLNESISLGNKEIEGLLQIDSGVVSWYNSNEMESEEENQVLGEVMEYIEHKEVKTLYTELIEDTDGLEEIISMCSDEDDICLRVVTKSICNNTVYVHNYSRLADGEVDKITVIACVEMFKVLFKMD